MSQEDEEITLVQGVPCIHCRRASTVESALVILGTSAILWVMIVGTFLFLTHR